MAFAEGRRRSRGLAVVMEMVLAIGWGTLWATVSAARVARVGMTWGTGGFVALVIPMAVVVAVVAAVIVGCWSVCGGGWGG